MKALSVHAGVLVLNFGVLAQKFALLLDLCTWNVHELSCCLYQSRKALHLTQYLLDNKADRNVAVELGLPNLMVHLASSDDSGVREAALGGLLQLARDRTSAAGNTLPNQDKLKDILRSRIEGISAMDADDLQAAREERQLVDSLWKECYDEPSSLREKGLVVLPGEDAPQQPPPDVAGKMFEPPLRAFAAPRPALTEDYDSGSGKKDPPLLLGP
jgi:hsp70-interacting protein